MLPLEFSLVRFFRTLPFFILPKAFALAQVEDPLETLRFCKHNLYLLFTIHLKEKGLKIPQYMVILKPFPHVFFFHWSTDLLIRFA